MTVSIQRVIAPLSVLWRVADAAIYALAVAVGIEEDPTGTVGEGARPLIRIHS